MARYRDDLPQSGGGVFLADSGLETDLLFNHGIDLPEFASFPLLADDAGTALLRDYFVAHAALARDTGVGVVLETPTWRASRDWGARLGYGEGDLDRANRAAVDLVASVRDRVGDTVVVVSGNLGPRADAYRPESLMGADEAQDYHRPQIATFADTEADLVTAMTITYPAEAIGIARAAAEAEIPAVLSFTVETDGRLPDGTALADAIEAVEAATDAYPTYYMLNCAHPSHFADVLAAGGAWTSRLGGVRANASRMSHAELDEAEELDAGDPVELGRDYAALRELVPNLMVLGGCCGTDVRHVEAIARATV